MSDLSGRVLAGRFELVRLLVEADEASLYEAVQLDVGRRVALKVLADGRAGVDAARLRQEAYAMATIDDAHVAKVLEIGGGEGTGDPTFLVMERRTGETLEKRGPMSAESAVHVAVQIAHALDAAHAVGIIHRDVRPSNVSLVRTAADDAFVELTGFGLAKALYDSDQVKTLTVVAAQRTRDRFTPPEGNARDVAGPATDIFGAGACLEALLRETPDASLAQIIARATAKDPKARFATAAELKAALKAWTPVVRAHEPPQAKARARPLLIFSLAAIASASLALVALMIVMRARDRDRDRDRHATASPAPAASDAPPASASTVETEIVPDPAAPIEPMQDASAPAPQAAKSAPRPPRGSFDLVGPLARVPRAEGEAWRVATTKKVNACIKEHGLGECEDAKEVRLLYYLHWDGKITGAPPWTTFVDGKTCTLPPPLAQCLSDAPEGRVSKPTMKETTMFVESHHRARRVE